MQVQAADLKLCSHCAPTMAQQVKAMICGLWYNIYRLHQRVVALRADIAVSPIFLCCCHFLMYSVDVPEDGIGGTEVLEGR